MQLLCCSIIIIQYEAKTKLVIIISSYSQQLYIETLRCYTQMAKQKHSDAAEKLIHMQSFLEALFSSVFLVVEYPHTLVSTQRCGLQQWVKSHQLTLQYHLSVVFIQSLNQQHCHNSTCVQQNRNYSNDVIDMTITVVVLNTTTESEGGTPVDV